MILCPICETENEDGISECILCGGELESPVAVEVIPSLLTDETQLTESTPQDLPAHPATPDYPLSLDHTSSQGEIEANRTITTPMNTIPAEPPAPGTLCLIVYFQRKPALYFPVLYDEILIGRTDPASNSFPDLDVTPYDPELAISRKHAYLYREGENHYIYPISNSGTQVNQEMVDIGAKKKLQEGDVVILSGRLAIRFARMPANPV